MDGSLFIRLPSSRKEEIRAIVDAALSGSAVPSEAVAVAPDGYAEEIASLKRQLAEAQTKAPVASDASQVAALLADVERLTEENATLQRRLERCARMTDDEKCKRWMQKYEDLYAEFQRRIGSAEFAQ